MQTSSPGIFRLFTALAALGALAAPAAAGPYRNEVNHFRVEVPQGWRPMTAAELKAVNDGLKITLKQSNPTGFLAGFLPEEDASGGIRKVLIQARQIAWSGADTRETIERDLGRETGRKVVEAGGEFAAVLRGAGENNAAMDWGHGRFVYVKVLDNDTGKTVRYTSSMQFCRAGSLHISCYSAPDSFDADLPAFQVLNDSFALDEGSAFVPASAADRVRRAAYMGLSLLVCVGLFAVLLIVLVVVPMRRRNRLSHGESRRGRSADDDDDDD